MTLSLLPDPGEPRVPAVHPAPQPEPHWLDRVTAALDVIPGWAWAITLTALTLLTLLTLPLARNAAFKAGRRTAGKDNGDSKGTALFVAAMVPAAFFWLAVLAGSFRGLAGFGRDTLKWCDGWEYLVPLTLDGIAISFGFLAFRAVKSGRSPERATRIVMGTALASALINYGHEVSIGGSKLGGAYLALLSVLGMLIFHEFLDQFTEGVAYVQRVNPSFGMRWATWPSNTVCAWIAWRNYPPKPLAADASEAQKMWWGSVNHAIAHLNTVRRAKRIARFTADVQEAALPAPWWMVAVPWLRARQLDAALTAERTEHADTTTRLTERIGVAEAERSELAAAAERVESERIALSERVEQISAERAALAGQVEQSAKQIAALESERIAERGVSLHAVQIAEQKAEQVRAEYVERERQIRAEFAERIASLQSKQVYRSEQSSTARTAPVTRPTARSGGSEQRSNAPKLTDEEAVGAMLRAHPERSYDWKPREVHRITGAGFGRIPKLIAMVAEHHEREPSSSSDDMKEDATDARPRAHAAAI